MKSKLIASFSFAALMFVAAPARAEEPKTIAGIVAGSKDHTILLALVKEAGLAETLSGKGEWTVFAPTDAAFAGLLAELGVSKSALLADKPLLTKVLTYHVVSGRVFKADVPVGAPIGTVQTGTFSISAELDITDARSRSSKIVGTDTLTSNGVIHVIDKVLLPAP